MMRCWELGPFSVTLDAGDQLLADWGLRLSVQDDRTGDSISLDVTWRGGEHESPGWMISLEQSKQPACPTCGDRTGACLCAWAAADSEAFDADHPELWPCELRDDINACAECTAADCPIPF
jgi:hypothetical protein